MSNFIGKRTDRTPDWSKPLSCFSAPYWAMMYGIAEALGATDWALLTALYTHVPHVQVGKDRLSRMAGISLTAVKRGRKRMKEAGLINYEDDLVGGSKLDDDAVTHYIMTDLRNDKVAAAIVKKLNVMNLVTRKARKPAKPNGQPKPANDSAATAQGFDHSAQILGPKDLSGGHRGPGTGTTEAPHRGHRGPGTGATEAPKVLKGSSQPSTQSKTPAAASPPPAVPVGTVGSPAVRNEGSGQQQQAGPSAADTNPPAVAKATEKTVPAPALPRPVEQVAGQGERAAGLSATSLANLEEFQKAVAKRGAELAAGATGADDSLHQNDGEADGDDANDWDGAAARDEWDDDNAVAEPSLVAA